ncbi:MAG: hypothetical protein IJ408_01745 [Clostridia bacterium]|nr:hypothetical protein [Clostridia bacterium]
METKTQIKNIGAFCNKKAFKLISIGFACLIGLLAIYSFVKTPFTGDIKVFMAAANQVKYQEGDILHAIFEAWELKAIGSRLLMYIIYAISDMLVGFENKIAFEAVCKLVYALMLSGIFAGTAALLPFKTKNKFLAFAVMFFAFFASGTAVQMQVEMTCIAICLLAAACLIKGKVWSVVLSGFLCSTLFFFKSVFILLYVSIILIYALYKRKADKKSLIISVLSTLGFSAFFFAGVYLIYPQEFADMAHASEYQATLLSEGASVSLQSILDRFFTNLVTGTVMAPVILFGIISTVFIIIKAIREKDTATWILLTALWAISIDIIVVSNTYFAYHYFLLVLPSLIAVLLYFKAFPETGVVSLAAAFISLCAVTLFNLLLGKDYEIAIFNVSTGLLVILHLIAAAVIVFTIAGSKKTHGIFTCVSLTVCFFLWANFLTALAPYYKNIRALDANSVVMSQKNIPSDIGDGQVLFLDAGSAPFYIDAPSYSRYFFNLPLQRWNEGDEWEWKDTEYEKLLAFDGKYVVIDYSWFKIDKYPELKAKLESEYVSLPSEDLRFYSPNWRWYDRIELSDYKGEDYITGAHILVRK